MKFKLNIDGKEYEVDVEAQPEDVRKSGPAPTLHARVPAPAPPSASGPLAGAPASGSGPIDETKVCRSPIAGVVVKVAVQPGQTIQSGDVLMILEAMKMETTITSPVAGKVAKINAAVGDSVQSGQILVEFE